MKASIPPKWIDRLIDSLAPGELAEEIRGDMYEMFLIDLKDHGEAAARRKYVWRGLGFLSKRFFWKRNYSNQNSWVMTGNYFKMASRSLLASRATSFINVIGLVTGIAAALTLIMVIRYELSFDKFHTDADRIYHVVRVSGPNMDEFRSGVSFPVPRALREEIPALKDLVAVDYFGGAYVDVLDSKGGTENRFREENGFALVEPSFFNILDFANTNFKWLAGNPEKALVEPFSVVITRSLARKYFGDEDPINRVLKMQRKYDCKVTGVIEDFPSNTDFPFTALVAYSSVSTLAGEEQYNNWYGVDDSHNVFLKLPEGMSKTELEGLIHKVHAAHTPKELHESRHYLLQELKELHHDARFSNFNGRTISSETLIGLAAVGVFLLLVACINYINLATAQSTLRSKEIGVRKVMGSSQKQVMLQFIAETFVLVTVAGLIGIVGADALLISLGSLFSIKLDGHIFSDTTVWASLLAIILSVTFFAGIYPAIVMARFNPVTALKNKLSTERSSIFSLRKVLVVGQFTITQVLVVATFIVMSQMRFFNNVDMGFTREGILNTRLHKRDVGTLQILRDKLMAQPYVETVSFSFTLPSGVVRSRSYADIGRPEAQANADYQIYEYVSIDPQYLGLYNIKLLAGRNLDWQDSVGNIIINKSLAKNLDLGMPQDVIGKQLKFNGGQTVTVVGVIDDYYSNSLKEQADNIVMAINREAYNVISIKLNLQSGLPLQGAVDGIGKIWSEVHPEYLYTYMFLDENIESFYEQEAKYARMFQLFSFVFLVIGLLGTYGLITFLINRKSKEVAIRKVLGASISGILVLFSKDYLKLTLISFCLAVPVTYYFASEWLNTFANHIELEWWLFLIPGAAVLTVTLLVVGMKMMGTARMNPVEKLKYE